MYCFFCCCSPLFIYIVYFFAYFIFADNFIKTQVIFCLTSTHDTHTAAVVSKLEKGKEVAEKIFGECVKRRVLLQQAATVTTVAASVTIRLTVHLWAEAAAAQINANLLALRVGALAGLLGVPATDKCSAVFTPEQCQLIADLQALEALRKQDRAAGKPERLAPLEDGQLQTFVAEQVSAEHETQLGVLADAGAEANPFKANGDAVKLFDDIKKINAFVKQVKSDLEKTPAAERDPIVGATFVASRQFVHAARYLAAMRSYNLRIQAWDAAHQGELEKYRGLPECTGAGNFQKAECKTAIVAAIKADYGAIFEATFNTAKLMEAARIRGAFVVKYIEHAAKRTAVLWQGVVRCVVVLRRHVARLVVAHKVALKIKEGLEARADVLAKIKENWDRVRALLTRIDELKAEGKTADDLTADERKELSAAVVAINEARADIRGDLVKLWVKVQVARSVVCRRRLKKAVAFTLVGICKVKAEMGDDECKERVQNYFNGLKEKIVENKDKIAEFKAAHLKCWPLIRFQIGTRVALGAAAVAALGSGDGENDGVLDRIDSAAQSPCVDGEACEETKGKLWIPADCTLPAAEPTVDSEADAQSEFNTDETSSGGTRRRKRSPLEVRAVEAAEEQTATEIAAMLSVDANSKFTLEDDDEVNVADGDEEVVGTDDALVHPPTCKSLGVDGCDERANVEPDDDEYSAASSVALGSLAALALLAAL
jgi:hypothetical protein